MLCQSFWSLFPLCILIYHFEQDCPFPLYTQPQFSSVFSLRSLIHPSTPILFSGFPGNWSWMVTRDVLSLLRSQQQQDIMPDNFMLSWLEMDWPFQSWKLSSYVIHVRESPNYTIFGVITVFPKLTDTKPLPRSWFSCRTDRTSKTLVPTSNESILNKKNTYVSFGHLPSSS